MRSLIGVTLLGAGIAYLADPRYGIGRGNRRWRRSRARRIASSGASSDANVPNTPDPLLVERVRARMGHVVSNSRAIAVSAHEGRVTLRGPILSAEAHRLLDAVRGVSGVLEIDDQLSVGAASLARTAAVRADRVRSGMALRALGTAAAVFGLVRLFRSRMA